MAEPRTPPAPTAPTMDPTAPPPDTSLDASAVHLHDDLEDTNLEAPPPPIRAHVRSYPLARLRRALALREAREAQREAAMLEEKKESIRSRVMSRFNSESNRRNVSDTGDFDAPTDALDLDEEETLALQEGISGLSITQAKLYRLRNHPHMAIGPGKYRRMRFFVPLERMGNVLGAGIELYFRLLRLYAWLPLVFFVLAYSWVYGANYGLFYNKDGKPYGFGRPVLVAVGQQIASGVSTWNFTGATLAAIPVQKEATPAEAAGSKYVFQFMTTSGVVHSTIESTQVGTRLARHQPVYKGMNTYNHTTIHTTIHTSSSSSSF